MSFASVGVGVFSACKHEQYLPDLPDHGDIAIRSFWYAQTVIRVMVGRGSVMVLGRQAYSTVSNPQGCLYVFING
jgi:hypothetical protein